MKNARGAGGALLRFCPAGRLAGSACGRFFALTACAAQQLTQKLLLVFLRLTP
ncbi:hypothetical protein [Campylobacter sp.]|uniref:hypothetical protein n=1 Tax=Campylobacter sp. TaxID=205 RepID=UPI002A810729|nr:hypothetical protein [Campylobacter sp.]MDY4154855.1 hypothetical protein [Campylobacter sp.]